jgi:hypothetical protein
MNIVTNPDLSKQLVLLNDLPQGHVFRYTLQNGEPHTPELFIKGSTPKEDKYGDACYATRLSDGQTFVLCNRTRFVQPVNAQLHVEPFKEI